MVERVLVVGPRDTISMVDELAPKGFEIVKALHNSPEMKAALPGADYFVGFIQQYVTPQLFKDAPRLKLIHFDAHTDRRDIANEGKLPVPDCGNFVEHLLRNVPGLEIMTIGVRGWTKHPVHSAGNYHQVPVRQLRRDVTAIRDFCGDSAVYLSLDIDVLDPSVAPEVAFASPAGLMLNELQDLLDLALENSVLVGADFVEVCDWNDRRNLAVWSQVAAITTVLEHLLVPER